MPTTSPPLIPLPAPSVPLIDPLTGLVSKAWYEWLIRMQQTLTKVRAEIP